MFWRKGRRSDNVTDTQDEGDAGGGGGMRIGGKGPDLGRMAIMVVVGLLMSQDPMQILGPLLDQMDSPVPITQQQVGGQASAANNEQNEFVRSILDDTEDTQEQIFTSGQTQYQQPKLVLSNNGVNSACGSASSAIGPFYCPTSCRVYLNLEFFRKMKQRSSAVGDFTQAYVIAHEVGHHVQDLMGTLAKISAARQRGARIEGANDLSVCQELQADCFAGAQANHTQQRLNWLEPGDIEEVLNAANAIGSDCLQRQGHDVVVSDSFIRGSLAQRICWFKIGFEGDSPASYDTFKAQML